MATFTSTVDQIVTNNVAPTTTNSNISAAVNNTAPTITSSTDLTPPHNGKTVMKFSTATGVNAFLAWDTNKWASLPGGNVLYTRFYFYQSFTSTSLMAIAGHGDVSNGLSSHLRLTTARKISPRNAAGGTLGTMLTAIPLNQWVRIETRTVLASSGGSIQVRLYTSPESTTPTEDFTSTLGDTLASGLGIERLMLGDPWGGWDATNYYADFAASDTTWLGPATASGTQSGAVAMTASHTLSGTTTGAQVRQGAVAMTASHSMISGATVQSFTGAGVTTVGATMVSPGDATKLSDLLALLEEDKGSGRVDAEIIAAILSGVTSVTRRAEIYERDGATLWLPTADTPRLIDGEVTIDYSRDERRAVDCTFDNSDGVLDHNPNGFWYDKILKFYRGIQYQNEKVQPSILIIQDDTVSAQRIFVMLRALKYTDITVKSVSTLEDLYGYDVVVAASGNSTISSSNSTLLQAAFDAGYNILTAGNQNTETQLPDIISTTVAKTNTQAWGIGQVATDNPVKTGWSDTVLTPGNTATGRHITALAPTASPVAAYTWAGVGGYTGAYSINATGGRWLHLQLVISPQSNYTLSRLIRNSVDWLYSYAQVRSWEIQIGEFMIDKISHDHFPSTIKVTGRDYTKKVMGTKFKDSLTFSAGTLIDTLVRALGANAGITKFLLNAGTAALGSDMTFARGDDRWKAIKDCCTAASIEVFFNQTGHLVTRPFKDPVTAPTTFTLSLEEADANLTELGIESSDTSIYNTVVVTAETADGLSDGVFYQATAVNDDPGSATAVSRIGERTYMYSTAAATSNDQCMKIANNLLRVMALEEYTLNFSALVFPWVDAGDIVLFKKKVEGTSTVPNPLTTIDPRPYQTAVSNDSPSVWFHMDDSNGALQDSVAGIAANVTGTVGYNAAGITAEAGSLAISFTNGALNYAQAASNSSFSSTNITVEALFKSNGLVAGNRIVEYGNDNSWRLLYDTGGVLVFEVMGHGRAAYTWAGDTSQHHVAGTYDSATGYTYLYLDGSLVASQTSGTTPGAVPTSADGLRIAGKPTGTVVSDGWNGTLDEIAIYSRALAPGAISAHAAARTTASTTSTLTGDPVPVTPEILPDRYLLTSVTIPLGLEPMSGIAKRVTIVAPLDDSSY